MVKKIAENFNRLNRVHQRYRQTTDGRPIAYSEREREFTSAKNPNRFQKMVWSGILKFFAATVHGNFWLLLGK